MDYRQRAFKTKFANAAKCLGVKPEQVVSLKFREIVHSYREYDLLMDMLEHEVGIVRSPVHEDLQGQGHLLQDGKNQILVVQHETGLEILYIFGSIASLLGLIPLVLQCWSRLGGHSRRPHADHLQQIETRRLDKKGHLVEDPAHGLLGGLLSPFAFLNSALTDAVEAMDSELQSLRTELQALMGRVWSSWKKIKGRLKADLQIQNLPGKNVQKQIENEHSQPSINGWGPCTENGGCPE